MLPADFPYVALSCDALRWFTFVSALFGTYSRDLRTLKTPGIGDFTSREAFQKYKTRYFMRCSGTQPGFVFCFFLCVGHRAYALKGEFRQLGNVIIIWYTFWTCFFIKYVLISRQIHIFFSKKIDTSRFPLMGLLDLQRACIYL